MGPKNREQARKAEQLADEIAYRSRPDDTPGDRYAIGASLTDRSDLIDEALRIIEELEGDER